MKISKKRPHDEKPVFWKRIARLLLRILIVIPLILVLILCSLSLINPPFSFQIAKSFISHGNINHEWIDYEELPDGLVLSHLVTQDEFFCTHWGFGLNSSRDSNRKKPTTLTQKAVRSLFLGSADQNLRRVLETPLGLLAEIFWSKKRILEFYLNYVKTGTSIFGVAAASQTILDKNIENLTLEESALLTVMLEAPNDFDPFDLPPELKLRIEWIVEKIEAIKADGKADCLIGK